MAEDVPNFDDIPSFDALPDAGSSNPAPQQTAASVPAFDDIPAFDDLPGEQQRPQAESALKSGVRAAASGVIPGLGGLAGAGAGAEAGAALGALAGPVGAVVGGVGGAIAGAFGGAAIAGKVQDAGKEALGLDDSTQQAANAEAHPIASTVGDLAGNMVGMNPAKAASLGARAVGGGVMGGIEAGRQAISSDEWDPTKIALNVAAGALAPNTNRLGAAVEGAGRGAAKKFIPGRPNVEPRPEDAQAQADVGQSQATNVAPGGVTEQTPVRSTETTGNPQSAPTRSNRAYGKVKKFLGGEDTLTTGDMDPATEQALAPEESWLNTSGPRVPRPGPENPGEELPLKTGIAEAAAQPQAAPSPPVDTGIVQAAQANANKPTLTLSRPKAAQDAIAASKALHPKTAAVAEAAKAANPEPTPAQIEAGNQKKGHERFAGKPISIENAEGSIRRSKPGFEPAWEVEMPYHYGDIKGTRGADKDPIDIAFDPQGGDNHYVIDQKNAETGKFDEHKVFAHTTTPERVRALYHAGFSDARGPERLGAITKVSEDELAKWFKNPAQKNKPFSKTFEEGVQRPVAEAEAKPEGVTEAPKEEPYTLPPIQGAVPVTPKVVTATVTKLRASENPEHAKVADAIEAMTGKEQALAAAKADVMLKTGKVPDKLAVARLRPTKDNLKAQIGDEVVEARSKADLARKVNAYSGLKEAFDKHAPAENETPEATRARAEAIVADTTKHLLAYRPNVKPAEYMLARAAKQLAGKKISVNKFVADEKLLRSGNKDAITQVRQGDRIEADIGRSKRPTVEQAEMKAPSEESPHISDDAPHESAGFEHVRTKDDLPSETGKALDITKPEDHAQITAALDTEAVPKENWKDVVGKQQEEQASKMQRLREARLAAEKSGTKPALKTPEWIKAHAKETAAEAKAEAGKKEADARSNITKVDLQKKGRIKDLFDAFANDERGSGDIGKVTDDLKDAMFGKESKVGEKLDLLGDREFGPAKSDELKSEPTKPKSDYWQKKPAKSYIARDAMTPSEDYARSLSDDLHKLRQGDVEHSHELLRWMKALPDAMFKKSGGSSPIERMYFARENNSINTLDPKEQADYNRLIKPMLDENDKLFENINKIAPERLGPDVSNHIYRITKGNTPEYNVLKTGQSTDPVAGVNGVSVAAKGPALARRFVALENDATGMRHVISLNDNGFTVMKDGKGQKVKDPNFNFEEGGKYHVGNDTFTMKQAMTPEIEEHARFEDGKRVKYFHNAALSAGLANRYLGNMARHLQFLEDLKGNDTFKKFATPSAKEAPEGWVETSLPNFKGWKMDPQLAHVMDDYAQPGFNEPGLNSLRKLSQAITKTIFWLPTAHINNVGAHWFVERGWDWVKPMEYRHLVVDGMKAIKSVITQDAYQTKLRDAGAGTIYGGVSTQHFMDQFAKGVGEAIEKNPSKWDPIARQFGLGPSDLVKAIYKASSHVMWAANDAFLTESVMRGERKGLSVAQAITEAERHIPNYRVPATIMGSQRGARVFSQIMQDPLFMAFGRYHYGVFNSYANMAKDLVKGNGADKLHAVGNLMAIGLLALGVYPVLDKAAKMITGNDEASQQRRGPLAIPAHLNAARKGEEDFASAARSTFTLPPMLTTAIQAIGGKDYRGKNIIEPGDLRSAGQGSLPAAARAAGQGADFLARGLVSPYSTLSNTLHKKESPGEGLRDQALDQKNPSAAARKYLANVPKRSQQEAMSRFKKPTGLIEGLVNKAVGFR